MLIVSIGVQVIFILESRSPASLKRNVTVRSAPHPHCRCCIGLEEKTYCLHITVGSVPTLLFF